MQLLVFVTDDGNGGTTGPTLYVVEDKQTTLPPNPRSLEWRYFATISEDDEMFRSIPASDILPREQGYFITNRMI